MSPEAQVEDRILGLIAQARHLSDHPGQHVAFQPDNPDGSVIILAGDFASYNLVREVGDAALAVGALRALLDWAGHDIEHACDLGLIVPKDHPDADLILSPEAPPEWQTVITAHQLRSLRAAQIKLVVLCPRTQMTRR